MYIWCKKSSRSFYIQEKGMRWLSNLWIFHFWESDVGANNDVGNSDAEPKYGIAVVIAEDNLHVVESLLYVHLM